MQVDKAYIIRVRRELHKIPELGFDLGETLAVIRRELEEIGLPYTEDFGRSCIIATLNEGIGNKTIALRADIDALPIQEDTGLDFASTHPGKMHACGHDCHAAMLLGTAKALKAMEKDIKCCVKFIFQSAEELLGGAKSICEDGFMEQVDMIVGCHIMPDKKSGTILLSQACANASSHGFKIHLHGKSCHVARPHLGVDAIAMASRVYTAIQTMRARELNPFEPVVVGIGEIHGGNANNIVCDYVMMHGTIRALSPEMGKHVYDRIQSICQSIAKDMGGSAEVETSKYAPCLCNNHSLVNGITAAAARVVGAERVLDRPTSMGAEDFAYYLRHKPGAMFSLGAAPAGRPIVPLHNGKMIVDEDALEIAPMVFIQFILDQMDK